MDVSVERDGSPAAIAAPGAKDNEILVMFEFVGVRSNEY